MRFVRVWLVGLILWSWAMPAVAVTVISNSPVATDGGTTVSNVDWKALIFTSGTGNWSIDNVVLALNPVNIANVPSSPKVEVALYSVAGGLPATQIATTGLQTVNINQLRQNYSLATSGFQLSPATTYALVVRSDATGIKWGNTATTEPTASAGFSYSTFQGTGNSGGSWDSGASIGKRNAVEVNASGGVVSVPVLSVWTMLLMAAVMAGMVVFMRPRSKAAR